MPDSAVTSDPASPPVVPAEWWLVGTLVLTSILLRCWQLGHMAVEHFDEGVYASNLYCPPENAYPFRHLYAPPLLPALLEWSLILSGGAAGSVMTVNVVAGCLMVPSIWWVGRQWFGPVAGLASAALATFSELHILYSRTALTDALLCFWLLWGVYWSWRAILTGRPTAILLAGIFASLAWWTKYNGWLTLAISGSGTLAWVLVDQLVTRRFAGHFKCPAKPQATLLRWFALAAIAFVGWLPYLVSLQDKGGYAPVAANHAGYFVGFAGWWEGLTRQVANLFALESSWTMVGLVTALVVSIAGMRLRGIGQLGPAVVCMALLYLLRGNVTIVVATGLALPLALLAPLIRRRQPNDDAAECEKSFPPPAPRQRLAEWMLAAWFFGLVVAIPLYFPYPRLTLPLSTAGCLGIALGTSLILPPLRQLNTAGLLEGVSPIDSRLGTRLLVSGVGISIVLTVGFLLTARVVGWQPAPAWENRTGLQSIATSILSSLPNDEDQVVYVLGEPALFFHLANQSDSPGRVFVPAADLASLGPPERDTGAISIYALQGPHARRTPTDPAAGISWAESNAQQVAEWTYEPSTLVLLNQHTPAEIRAGIAPEPIRLLRIGE